MHTPKSVWEVHVKKFDSCSMSKLAFCKKHQLSYSSFCYWFQQLRKDSYAKEAGPHGPKSGFLPIRIVNASRVTAPIKLRVNNIHVFVEENFNPTLLKQTIAVLKEC